MPAFTRSRIIALELGEHAHHLKHRLAGRCRRVDALLMQEQVDPQAVRLG